MSKLKYPYALDDCGNPVYPNTAEKGEKYHCPICKALGLVLICPKDAKRHFRSLKDVHTGALCKKIERKKDATPIDKATLKRNCMRPPSKSQVKQDEGEIKHPGSPRKASERATWCPTLKDIIHLEFDKLDDFDINEKEKLSDHFISAKTASLVMDRNEALGPRALEVFLGDAIIETKTIRCYLRAEVQQEDGRSAEQKVFDLIAKDQEQFDLACNMFFETFEEFGPTVVLGSKFRRAFIFGDFHLPSQGGHQVGINGCSMECQSSNALCTGRQESILVNSMNQIAVSKQDLVDNYLDYEDLKSFGIMECRYSSDHSRKDDSPVFKLDLDAAMAILRLHEDFINDDDIELVEDGSFSGKTQELSNQSMYDWNARSVGSVHHSTMADAVAWAMSNRIADDIIRSDADWNRRISLGDAITFIWRAMGSPYPVYANEHHNKMEKRFYNYLPLIWASKNRIVPNKRSILLRINTKCTRGDFLAYLWSALFLGISELGYETIYQKAIEWAYHENYVYGIDDGQFNASQPITYGEAMLFIYRAMVSGR